MTGSTGSTLRDATVRGQAEVAIKHEQALLSAMNHISAALLEGHELDDTFRAITHHARRLVNADYAMLTVPNDDDSALVMRAVDGDGLADLEGATVPYETSMAGTVIRDREPQLLADAATDARMYRPDHWPRDAGPALFVPLHAGNQILGSLTVAHRHDRDLFTVADIARVKTFAAHAAVALEDTRRQAAIHRLRALDEDRERVAAALHDTVIGRVSSASLRLQDSYATTSPTTPPTESGKPSTNSTPPSKRSATPSFQPSRNHRTSMGLDELDAATRGMPSGFE